MLALITDAVDDRSARGIAAAVGRLVSAGSLPAGARLPTVRDVARERGVSPTTVSEAWRSLTRAGAIQTRGRSGTFVSVPVAVRQSWRFSQMGAAAAPLDLSTGRHTLGFWVDAPSRKSPTLRCEILNVPGSAGRAQWAAN